MYPLALRLFINARTLDMGYPSSDEISVRVSAFWRSANRSSIASTRSADLTEADGPVLVLFSDMVASEKRRAPKQSSSRPPGFQGNIPQTQPYIIRASGRHP